MDIAGSGERGPGRVPGAGGAAGLDFTSGVVMYRVRNGRIDDGRLLPL